MTLGYVRLTTEANKEPSTHYHVGFLHELWEIKSFMLTKQALRAMSTQGHSESPLQLTLEAHWPCPSGKCLRQSRIP